MIALLDANVLLALAWPNHQHHDAAQEWFHRNARLGWASCALTELAFVRLSSNPAYTPDCVSPSEAAELLSKIVGQGKHHFFHSPAASDPETFQTAVGHQQVNDAWIVMVAGKNSAKVVTCDARLGAHAQQRRIPVALLGVSSSDVSG